MLQLGLVLLALAHAGCGLGFTRTSETRGGWAPTPVVSPSSPAPGGPSGLPGVKIVTINRDGALCTLVFWDGLYVGGTC